MRTIYLWKGFPPQHKKVGKQSRGPLDSFKGTSGLPSFKGRMLSRILEPTQRRVPRRSNRATSRSRGIRQRRHLEGRKTMTEFVTKYFLDTSTPGPGGMVTIRDFNGNEIAFARDFERAAFVRDALNEQHEKITEELRK